MNHVDSDWRREVTDLVVVVVILLIIFLYWLIAMAFRPVRRRQVVLGVHPH